MGAQLQYQFQKQGSSGWENISDDFSNDRSYLLYSWLGLENRNDGSVVAVAPLRDLPDDIELRWDCDLGWDDTWGEHSHSWLLSEEILNATPPIPVDGEDSGPVVQEFCAEVKRLQDVHGVVRMVFGFSG